MLAARRSGRDRSRRIRLRAHAERSRYSSGMKLVRKLVLAIFLAFLPVLATTEYLSAVRALRLLEEDTRRDLTELGRVISAEIEHGWMANPAGPATGSYVGDKDAPRIFGPTASVNPSQPSTNAERRVISVATRA